MPEKEVIILAGGLGTRLQGVLSGSPKCMAPVNGMPFLCYVFDYLISQKVDKAIISVGFLKEQVISYFGNSFRNLAIEYSSENEPLGTGGAIKLALGKCVGSRVFVINGDTFFIPDLAAMEQLHVQKKSDITISVKFVPDAGRYGKVLTDETGRITSFSEKDPLADSGWINGGIYLLKKQVFDGNDKVKFSIENELFKVSSKIIYMQAFETDAFFLDIGIPDDYFKAQTLFKLPENR